MGYKKENHQYHLDYYHNRRKLLIETLGGKCSKCGSNVNLELDHIVPDDKGLEAGKLITSNWKRTDVKAEIKKLQLLCELCHKSKTNSEKDIWRHGTSYSFMKKRCKCLLCVFCKDQFNARKVLLRSLNWQKQRS